MAYVRNEKELHVLTVPTEGAAVADRVVASGELPESSIAWSPDSQWIAYTADDSRSFRNVHVVPAAGGESHAVSFLANGRDWRMWRGRRMGSTFCSIRRSGVNRRRLRESICCRMCRSIGRMSSGSCSGPRRRRGRRLRQVTPQNEEKPATPAADAKAIRRRSKAEPKKKVEPVKIVFEGIRDRLTFLPLGLNAEEPVISPDGKTLVVCGACGESAESLYVQSG